MRFSIKMPRNTFYQDMFTVFKLDWYPTTSKNVEKYDNIFCQVCQVYENEDQIIHFLEILHLLSFFKTNEN